MIQAVLEAGDNLRIQEIALRAVQEIPGLSRHPRVGECLAKCRNTAKQLDECPLLEIRIWVLWNKDGRTILRKK